MNSQLQAFKSNTPSNFLSLDKYFRSTSVPSPVPLIALNDFSQTEAPKLKRKYLEHIEGIYYFSIQ